MGSKIKIRLQDRRWLGRTTGKWRERPCKPRRLQTWIRREADDRRSLRLLPTPPSVFPILLSGSFYSWGLRSNQTWHWSKLPVPSIESGCCLFRSTAWNFHSWKFRFPPGELGWCFRTSYCLLWVFPELSRLHQEADLGLVPKDLLGS